VPAATSASVQRGSSPRPWGTPQLCRRRPTRARFIPTPVGNTVRRVPVLRANAVHPHARGEHPQHTTDPVRRVGSSPRPWGTHVCRRRRRSAARFIPTPVGNTSSGQRVGPPRPVHPHARGEHQQFADQADALDGSSPRPWGTHPVVNASDPWARFIPTPVGNTKAIQWASTRPTVHPHARGEHGAGRGDAGQQRGSSPRPWGTRQRAGRAGRPARFIPTPVGNTATSRPTAPTGSVHPHARGEHRVGCVLRLLCLGSSPRPWGTLHQLQVVHQDHRFIPTPVGNTPAPGRPQGPRAVHPHARGEHGNQVGKTWSAGGSSPRPWGTRSAPAL